MLYRGSPFNRFAKWTSRTMGHPVAFVAAVLIIVVWAVTPVHCPLFGFSDTWQLVINTGTTIVTFLMVFLIQNTQNRDSEATQGRGPRTVYPEYRLPALLTPTQVLLSLAS